MCESRMSDPTASQIPFLDLTPQHGNLRQAFLRHFESVLESGQYIGGHLVEEFERRFAEYCSLPHCVTVGNGTDALELSLRAAGIGRGDEVLLPANSFIATATAVVRIGATPRFADVDAETGLIDPDGVIGELGSRIRALVPVHLYGQLAAV